MSTNKFLDKLNTKILKSRFSDCMVYFVDDNIDQINENDIQNMGYFVISDGLNMIDFKDNSEDDISNIYGITKTGKYYNFAQFLDDKGFYDNKSKEEILLKSLDIFEDR
jgi:hypothetical protein